MTADRFDDFYESFFDGIYEKLFAGFKAEYESIWMSVKPDADDLPDVDELAFIDIIEKGECS